MGNQQNCGLHQSSLAGRAAANKGEFNEVIIFLENGIEKMATYIRHEQAVAFDARPDWVLIAEPQSSFRSRQTPRWVCVEDIQIQCIRDAVGEISNA